MLTGTDLLTVERALQVALAPAFVLGGIMAVLNLLNTRLQRISDRERELRNDESAEAKRRHPVLRRRMRLTFGAIVSCILASVLLCLLVIVSFLEPVFGVAAGGHVVALLVAGMSLLTVALALYLLDMLVSLDGLDRGEL